MIKELVEYFGVEKSEVTIINRLEFLIKTQSDFNRLEELINENRNSAYSLFDALCQLHLEKVKENNMPFEEFEKLYNTDKVSALEKLFQEKIDGYRIYKLENKIASNRITLEELYNKHQKELNRRILAFLN